MKKIGIYRVTLQRPDGSVSHYVGQSQDILQRLRSHRYLLNRGSHTNRHLLSAWRLYGSEAFSFAIVEETSLDQLTERETWWIDQLSAHHTQGGFNQRLAADSNRGLKKSMDAIQRSNAYRKGRPLSEAHKAAIGAANRGRQPSAMCLAKAMEARRGKPGPMTGKTHTLVTRLKISETKRRA